MTQEKNNIVFSRNIKRHFLVILSGLLLISCNQTQNNIPVDKYLTICISEQNLACEIADLDESSKEIQITQIIENEKFKLVASFDDASDYTLSTGDEFAVVLDKIINSNSTKSIPVSLCSQKIKNINKGNILLTSKVYYYQSYALFYGRIKLSERESIEYNFLYHNGKNVYTDCQTIFLL